MNGICERKNCFGYEEKHGNNCKVLSKTYEDDYKCPFFKTEEEIMQSRISKLIKD